MLLDKLDGVGADRQVKWRFSLRCDFNKQAAESVRIALLGMVGGFRSVQRCSGRTRFLLIQIFLEADEDSSNVLRLAQVGHRVGN